MDSGMKPHGRENTEILFCTGCSYELGPHQKGTILSVTKCPLGHGSLRFVHYEAVMEDRDARGLIERLRAADL